MSRIFETPEAFLDWVKTQSKLVQISVCRSIETLMAAGVDGCTAAHVTYNMLEQAKRDVGYIDTPTDGKVH